MNCMNCNKKLGMFAKKIKPRYDEVICEECLKSWGFTEADLKNPRYENSSYLFLKRGKEECDRIIDQREYEKEHTKVKKVKLGSVDDPAVEKILNAAKNLVEKDELYGGYTNKELKEDLDEDIHHIYDGIDFPCEIKDGIYLDGKRVADLPDVEELKKYDCDTYLIILGGKFKQLVFDDYDESEIVQGEDDYWLMLKLIYVD